MIGEQASIAVRLQEIVAGIRRARSSLYPADWDFDPLIRVEKELEELLELLEDLKD